MQGSSLAGMLSGLQSGSMVVLTLAWIVVLVLVFNFTNERQRENMLLIFWALLLLPVIGYPLLRLIGS